MEAKITFYNENSGRGKLLTRDGDVHNFSVDAWRDFDVMPQVGVLVEFAQEGSKITKIVISKNNKTEPTSQSEQKKDTPQNTQKEQNIEVAKKNKNLPTLTVTRNSEECLSEYYQDTLLLVENYQNIQENEKELNFLRMKRFLFTAYNDLYELDSGLTDKDMANIKKELSSLQRDYETLKYKNSYPSEYLFEKIFLSRQQGYVDLNEELELTVAKVKSFSLNEKPLLDRMSEKEKEILGYKGDKKGDAYLALEEQLKHIKKRYVDLLHEVALMRDKQEKLRVVLEEFRSENIEEFLKKQQALSRYLDSKLIRMLNIKAYKFDTMLWERAKKSKIIRQFFMDADIDGTYSSKTFLKYYLRTLDKEKLSHENKELIELQKYLESLGNEVVLIVRNGVEKANKTKFLVESVDQDLKVNSVYDPGESFKICLKQKPDIIILDYNLRTINAPEYAKKYRELVGGGQKDPTFCVILDESQKNEATACKKMGFKHIINANWGDYQFLDFIRTIL